MLQQYDVQSQATIVSVNEQKKLKGRLMWMAAVYVNWRVTLARCMLQPRKIYFDSLK
jgi:hypothetical protein